MRALNLTSMGLVWYLLPFKEKTPALMKSWLHKLLLTFFVLLQCASPLVHAHIESVGLVNNTMLSGLNIHLDGIPTFAGASNLSDDPANSQTHLENQPSPQVSMPQVCVRNQYVFEQSILIVEVIKPAKRVLLEQLDFSTYSFSRLPEIQYLPAWPQAPPSSSLLL